MQWAEPVTGSSGMPERRHEEPRDEVAVAPRGRGDHRHAVERGHPRHVRLQGPHLVLALEDRQVVARGERFAGPRAERPRQRVERAVRRLRRARREVERQPVPVGGHPQRPALRAEVDLGPAVLDLVEDHPGRGERRVAAEVHLVGRASSTGSGSRPSRRRRRPSPRGCSRRRSPASSRRAASARAEPPRPGCRRRPGSRTHRSGRGGASWRGPPGSGPRGQVLNCALPRPGTIQDLTPSPDPARSIPRAGSR